MTAIPTEQLDRVLVGADADLALLPTDSGGDAYTMPGTAAATVEISDGAGAVVDGSDDIEVTIGEDGDLSCTVPAAMLDLLDSYLVVWTVTDNGADPVSWETTLELVGGFHFSIAAFRALRSEFSDFTAVQVRDARTLAEMRFEDECRVAFVPRGARETVRCDGTRMLRLRHVALREVYSLSVVEDGTTVVWTNAEIAELAQAEAGILTLSDDYWHEGAVAYVHYAHGMDRAPRPVREATMTLTKDYIVPDSGLPSRAVLQLSDYGNFRMAQRDEVHPFGDIPAVEGVYEFYRRRPPAIG